MKNSKLIKIRDIKKYYQMGRETVKAIDGVDLDVEEGEYISIMGPSGSGKSTLMNLIGCLDTPTEGSYRLKDNEVKGMKDAELSRIRNSEIGFIFQTFNLLPRNDALSNVELPLIYSSVSRKERKKLAERALTKVGLGDRLHHRPSELSGGQRQRVATAKAIVNEPALVLADEPTGNLDTGTGEEIMSLFADLNEKGNTLIVVTHEDFIGEKARRHINLKDGKIVGKESG